jgi:F-type H+-transporting ATPase subunit a
MAEHGAILWLSYIPGLGKLPPQTTGALFVLCLLTLVSYLAFRKMAQRTKEEILIPPPRFSLRNIFEIFSELILNFMEDIIGHRAREFLPLIGTLGFFILFSNLLGLVPGFAPPTDNLNTTVACALVVFFATHYYGIRAHGFRYIRHFLGPILWLSPLMFFIEIISHLARVLSLSMRLFGNITADHMILAMTLAAPSILVLLLPPLSMVLGIFVSLVQTFIFILLSMVYISAAIEEAEH